MVSVEKIKSCLKLLGDYSDEELEKYTPLLNSAAKAVKQDNEEDERAPMLAAAKVNYELTLIKNGGSSVTSFKAGDVSITENGNAAAAAKDILDGISGDCADLAADFGFAFRTT